jgi:drug/metabolite transporter (DMT)-like permease
VTATEEATPKEGATTPMLVAMILVSVTLAATAQLTLKSGMNQVTEANGGAVALSADSLKTIFSNLTVWLGLVLFGLSAIVWLFVLSRTTLSFAYPFAALTYILILLVDRFVLHETVPPLRWAGVALIMTGIVLVARTAPA